MMAQDAVPALAVVVLQLPLVEKVLLLTALMTLLELMELRVWGKETAAEIVLVKLFWRHAQQMDRSRSRCDHDNLSAQHRARQTTRFQQEEGLLSRQRHSAPYSAPYQRFSLLGAQTAPARGVLRWTAVSRVSRPVQRDRSAGIATRSAPFHRYTALYLHRSPCSGVAAQVAPFLYDIARTRVQRLMPYHIPTDRQE